MLISLFKYKPPKTHQISHEIPPFIYKIGIPSLKLPLISFFIMFFNFGYVYIINCGLSKYSSSNNITKLLHRSWNWWLPMLDTEGNKHICTLDNLLNCHSIHPPERKETSIIIWKFKNSFFLKRNLPLLNI